MEIKYLVHGITQDEFTVIAEVLGKPTAVKVPGIILELSSEDGSMGHTFRMMSDDIDATMAEYPIGSSVTVTVAPSGK